MKKVFSSFFSTAAILEMAAILKNPKTKTSFPNVQLSLRQVSCLSVEPFFQKVPDKFMGEKKKKLIIIIITRFKAVLGMPNTKCLPNELPLPLSTSVSRKTPKCQFSLKSEGIDIFRAIFSKMAAIFGKFYSLHFHCLIVDLQSYQVSSKSIKRFPRYRNVLDYELWLLFLERSPF